MAADGLESFSFSQYYPNHINIFAGSESEFILDSRDELKGVLQAF